MSQFALLLGTKNGKRTVIAEGDPRDIRAQFKHSDGGGFDVLEVLESGVGRSRRRQFKEAPAEGKKTKAK
jgi:hypothetical protein